MDKQPVNQPPTQPQPEQQPTTQLQDITTPPPPEKKKSNKWFIIALSLTTLLSLGIAGALAWKNYQYKQQNESSKDLPAPTKTAETQPTLTPSITPTQINWLFYQNEKYDYIKFKYPEGSSITMSSDPNPDICEMEGCFSLSMTYKDLRLDIKHLTGIGGMPSATDHPYTIVTGNYSDGVGKTTEENESTNTINIRYFKYFSGGQQFGGFLGQAQSFVFSMPIVKKTQYEPMTDVIACSVLNLEPENKGLFSRAYLNYENNTIVGVNEDQSTFTILSGDTSINEKVSNIIFNPTAKYITIRTVIGNGPETYLLVYDFATKSLIDIDGKNKYSIIGDPITWVDENSFIVADNNKYYRYYPEQNTRKEISADEYSNLLKSTSD